MGRNRTQSEVGKNQFISHKNDFSFLKNDKAIAHNISLAKHAHKTRTQVYDPLGPGQGPGSSGRATMMISIFTKMMKQNPHKASLCIIALDRGMALGAARGGRAAAPRDVCVPRVPARAPLSRPRRLGGPVPMIWRTFSFCPSDFSVNKLKGFPASVTNGDVICRTLIATPQCTANR